MTNEEYLIGCLLISEGHVEDVNEIVTPEMFSNPICRDFYKSILQEYESNKSIDIARIQSNLEKVHAKKEIEYVLQNSLSVMTLLIDSAETYADLIRKEYTAAEVINFIRSCSFKSVDIDETISELIKTLEGYKYNKKTYITDANEIFNQYENTFFTDNKEESIITGFDAVDQFIDLERRDVTILAARPSVGKSAFALQIALNLAEKGYKVGYFNLEMSAKQVMERIIANKADIPLARVRRATAFLGDEKAKFDNFKSYLKTRIKTLQIHSRPFTVQQISSVCHPENLDILVVDYLQLIKSERRDSRNVEVGDISRGLKNIAMQFNVHVIALSQMSRAKKATDEPELSDLRDSGEIEQDASNVMFLWNINEEGKVKGFKVAKVRQGEPGKKALEFNGSNMRFATISKNFNDVVKENRHMRIDRDNNPFE